MKDVTHDHRAENRPNTETGPESCNQPTELWVSHSSYQVIHKERVAFGLQIKHQKQTKRLEHEQWLALEKKHLRKINLGFGSPQSFVFPLHFILSTWWWHPDCIAFPSYSIKAIPSRCEFRWMSICTLSILLSLEHKSVSSWSISGNRKDVLRARCRWRSFLCLGSNRNLHLEGWGDRFILQSFQSRGFLCYGSRNKIQNHVY